MKELDVTRPWRRTKLTWKRYCEGMTPLPDCFAAIACSDIPDLPPRADTSTFCNVAPD